MNRRHQTFISVLLILFLSGCASVPQTRPGDVKDYDTFAQAFAFAYSQNKIEDGLFLKENFKEHYKLMIEKLVTALTNPEITKLEREAATELFYWAESLGRLKEYKEIK
jgi:hypothetical protein